MINFAIDSQEKVKQKLEMLEALGDIEIATKIMKDLGGDEDDIYDQHYKKLSCDIKYIHKEEKIFDTLRTFLINSSSDNSYQKLDIIEAFEIVRSGEHSSFDDCGNRMLLWHGSRITNFVGILSQGLRIAPPEAPVSGYNFGKGLYFADMASKSACYCYPADGVALILLCEVAVGKPRELLTTDFNAAKLPTGHHSTLGCGITIPSSTIKLDDGTIVPIGKPVRSTKSVSLFLLIYRLAWVLMNILFIRLTEQK